MFSVNLETANELLTPHFENRTIVLFGLEKAYFRSFLGSFSNRPEPKTDLKTRTLPFDIKVQ